MFAATSRYYGLPTTTIERPDGTRLVFVRRRFIPPPERFELLLEHSVAEGERLDHITARYLGDPEQFWRVAQGNRAMQPRHLVRQPGRRPAVPAAEGSSAAQGF